jgi:hypothetical protein
MYTFENFDTLQNAITYGEQGDKFFTLLKGVAVVYVPNLAIPDVAFKMKDYLTLLQWKKE